MMAAQPGFWRRALALCIDSFLVSLALFALAALLYDVTGGYVQYAGWPAVTRCRFGPPAHNDLPPPELHPTFEAACETRLLTIPIARTLTLGAVSRNGSITKTVTMTLAVDHHDQPVFALPLSIVSLPLLLLLRSLGDSLGQTPGRMATRIRLSTRSAKLLDEPDRAQVARRYSVFALPLLPSWMVVSWGTLFPVTSAAHIGVSMVALLISATPALGAMAWAAVSIIRRRDTFYDRAAGTAVTSVQQLDGDVSPPPDAP